MGRVAAGGCPPTAPSYGRNADFPTPPAQIPACPIRASQPGGDLLVGDDLGVGVTRPGQRHDEDPGAQQLTGARVEDLGTLAEVDLRGLAGVELEHGGDLRVSGLEACEEAAHRGVRAGEAVAAHHLVERVAFDSYPVVGPRLELRQHRFEVVEPWQVPALLGRSRRSRDHRGQVLGVEDGHSFAKQPNPPSDAVDLDPALSRERLQVDLDPRRALELHRRRDCRVRGRPRGAGCGRVVRAASQGRKSSGRAARPRPEFDAAGPVSCHGRRSFECSTHRSSHSKFPVRPHRFTPICGRADVSMRVGIPNQRPIL